MDRWIRLDRMDGQTKWMERQVDHLDLEKNDSTEWNDAWIDQTDGQTV